MKLQKLKYKALAVLTLFSIYAFWFGINNAFASDNKTSIFVTPMSQKIILTPGESYTGTITVANNSDAEGNLEYEAKIGSYSPVSGAESKDNYGGVDVDTVSNYNIMMDWVSLDKTTGTVAPNSQDIVTYTIKTPKNAPAGAQYASILITEKEKDDTVTNNGGTSGMIKSKVQLASIIYANVAGESIEKGSISENNMPSVLTSNKMEATSMVRNDGNIYTSASYTLQVWPMFSDEEICTNEESVETSLVLPNTERYHVQTCELPAVGIFRAKQVVKIFGEESVLEKTIFVCPIWLMILAIVIVVAIVIAIVVMVRKRKKSALQD